MLLPALSKCLPHLVVFITLISGEEGEHDANELCWVPFSLSLLSLKAVQAGLLRLSEFPQKGGYLPAGIPYRPRCGPSWLPQLQVTI